MAGSHFLGMSLSLNKMRGYKMDNMQKENFVHFLKHNTKDYIKFNLSVEFLITDLVYSDLYNYNRFSRI